ncbi:hypothetical protein HDU97_010265 [Phlyctochytrium planicorne]|nr:hypothetical protein HDU97_010265 [Phlyctochytrium planicorne]
MPNTPSLDILRHFGLSLLESCVMLSGFKSNAGHGVVMFDWDSEVKPILLETLTNGTMELEEERPFIIEKVIRLTVEAIKRFWPHSWDDLDAFLKTLYLKSPKHHHIVLGIFRSLSEDIFVIEEATAVLRKKELAASLASLFYPAEYLPVIFGGTVAPGVFIGMENPPSSGKVSVEIEKIVKRLRGADEGVGWMRIWAGECVERHNSYLAALASNSGEQALMQMITLDILKTIGPAMIWISIKVLGGVQVIYPLFQLLESPSIEIRKAAADAILLFMDRASMGLEEPFWTFVVTPVVEGQYAKGAQAAQPALIRHMISCWVRSTQVESGDLGIEGDSYQLAKTLAKIVEAFGGHLLDKKSLWLPKQFEGFLDLSLKVLEHPSCVVGNSASSVWVELFKHKKLGKKETTLPYAPLVTRVVVERLLHPKLSANPEVADFYLEQDADDSSDSNSIISAFRNRMLDLLKILTQLDPEGAFGWLSKAILETIRQETTVTEATTHRFESLADVFQSLVSGVRSAETFDDEKMQPIFTGFAIELLSTKNVVPQADYATAKMALALSETLANRPDLMNVCLEKVVVLWLIYRLIGVNQLFGVLNLPAVGRKAEADAIKGMKVGVMSCLCKFARALPDMLLGFYDNLLASVAPLVNNKSIPRLREFFGLTFVQANLDAFKLTKDLKSTHPALGTAFDEIVDRRVVLFNDLMCLHLLMRRSVSHKDEFYKKGMTLWLPYVEQVAKFDLLVINQPLVESLCASAESLSERHWKSIIVNVLPQLIQNAPKDRFSAFLTPLVIPVVDYMSERVDSRWSSQSERVKMINRVETELTGDDLQDHEVFADFVLRETTNAFVDFLSDIVAWFVDATEAELEKYKLNSERAVTFRAFFIEDMNVCGKLFSALIRVMSYPGTDFVRKSLLTFERLVINISDPEHQVQVAFFSGILLEEVLKVYRNAYFVSVFNECVSLIGHIYGRCVMLNPNLRMVFLALPDINEFNLKIFEQDLLKNKDAVKEHNALVKTLLKHLQGC